MPLGISRRTLTALAVTIVVACLALGAGPAAAAGVRSQEWWLRALHVTQAWHTTRGVGAVVAVLDTGVDPSQPDLTGSVRSGPDYTQSGRVPGGPYWGIHGTEMASIIAGHGHGPGNGDGIMGVAPAARILSVRVTLESSDPLLADSAITAGLPTAIAKGIRYAVKHGATVIDLPLDPVTARGAAGAGGSTAEQAAVSYALAHHVVLVAPAGDGGAGADSVNYPAAYHGVISVGAFNSNYVKAPFSSHQPYVTLTAAGEGVAAAIPPAGYATVNSTSAASAVVAGIAALIRSRFPALTPAQVRKALISSTVYRPVGGKSDGSGYGTADAMRALTAAAKLAAPPPTPGVSTHPATAAPSAAPAAGGSASTRTTLLVEIGVAVVVLAGILLSVMAVARKRRRARAARRGGARPQAEAGSRQPGPAGAAASTRVGGYRPAPPVDGAARSGGGMGPGWTGPAIGAAQGGANPGTGGATGSVPGRSFPASAFPRGLGGTEAASGGEPWDEVGGGAPGTGSPVGPDRTRRPKVSGSPPWGPAPRPDSELPWTGEPAGSPEARERLPQRRPQAERSLVWDTIAEEAWPGGPRAGLPGTRITPAIGPAGAQGADRSPAGTGNEDGTPAAPWETGRAALPGRPLSQSNPAAATETFPAVPPSPPPGGSGDSPRNDTAGWWGDA